MWASPAWTWARTSCPPSPSRRRARAIASGPPWCSSTPTTMRVNMVSSPKGRFPEHTATLTPSHRGLCALCGAGIHGTRLTEDGQPDLEQRALGLLGRYPGLAAEGVQQVGLVEQVQGVRDLGR